MPSSNPFLLLWTILITLVALGAFSLLIFLIINISSVRNYLQQNYIVRNGIVIPLEIIICVCLFWINTGFVARTSEFNPPHGVGFGTWDEDPSAEKFGGVALFYGDKCLPIVSGDSSLTYISNERFQRYLRPPFLRQYCYTKNSIGCIWADIDIANYEASLEWLDYLVRIGIAILSGFIGSEIIRLQMTKINQSPEPRAG